MNKNVSLIVWICNSNDGIDGNIVVTRILYYQIAIKLSGWGSSMEEVVTGDFFTLSVSGHPTSKLICKLSKAIPLVTWSVYLASDNLEEGY